MSSALDLAPGTLERERFLAWYRRNREWSRFLFDRVAPAAYEQRAIPLRHPPVFYEGHLPAFSFNKLAREALAKPSIDADLEILFERGIDPAGASAAAAFDRPTWPSRAAVQAFGERCDRAVEEALAFEVLDVPEDPRLARAQAVWTILEHEAMHHETFAYILHRIAEAHKHCPPGYRPPQSRATPKKRRIEIPDGTATLGADRAAIQFGWDNEFAAHEIRVGRFECDVYPITNEEWLGFVREGGPVPSFWFEGEDGFEVRGIWGSLEFPRSAPVWVTNEQANAYAEWTGRRIMTEAEYHRAAFGTREGDERVHPWGADPPNVRHGNFDWQQWDPQPVGSYPAGASAWGIEELVGNGWELTSTPFAPFAGFAPHASYERYSTDFFDGKHYVVKGASPVTSRDLIRRSFRNWYYADYPYTYAKFRTAAS